MLVWEIERTLAEDRARLIIFYPRSGICQYPQVKGLTVMVNSVYNGCLRATFIADPEGITVNDLSVGRNPEEVLRMLDALKPMSCARAIGRRARRR